MSDTEMCKHQRARRIKGGRGILECCECGLMFADLHSLRMERKAAIEAVEFIVAEKETATL